MPLVKRRHAETCSAACRKARSRANAIPAELTRRPRWVRRSAAKVPLQANGEVASATDPATWSDYRTVKASTAGAGMGFVLAGDGIVCLDLDHVLVDGRPTPAAARLLRRLPDTYMEISPSGTGLHVWGLGRLPRGRRATVDGVSVEAYGTGRYITMTGVRWSSTAELADLSGVLEALR